MTDPQEQPGGYPAPEERTVPVAEPAEGLPTSSLWGSPAGDPVPVAGYPAVAPPVPASQPVAAWNLPQPGVPQYGSGQYWPAQPGYGGLEQGGPPPLAWTGQAPATALPPAGQLARRRGAGALVALTLTGCLLAGVAGGATGAWITDRTRDGGSLLDRSAKLPQPVKGDVDRAPDSVAGIARAVLPSVVAIEVTGDGRGGHRLGLRHRRDGYILTNNHVVAVAGDRRQDPGRLPGRLAARRPRSSAGPLLRPGRGQGRHRRPDRAAAGRLRRRRGRRPGDRDRGAARACRAR